MKRTKQTLLVVAHSLLEGGIPEEKAVSAPAINEKYKRHFDSKWVEDFTDTVASRIGSHFDALKGGANKYNTNIRQNSLLVEVGVEDRGAILYKLQFPEESYVANTVDLFLDLIEELREAVADGKELIINHSFCLELFDYANNGLVTDGYFAQV